MTSIEKLLLHQLDLYYRRVISDSVNASRTLSRHTYPSWRIGQTRSHQLHHLYRQPQQRLMLVSAHNLLRSLFSDTLIERGLPFYVWQAPTIQNHETFTTVNEIISTSEGTDITSEGMPELVENPDEFSWRPETNSPRGRQ